MIAAGLLLLAAAGADGQIAKPEPVTIPADWHLIEGIATDGGRVWVSSVVDRAVLSLAIDGNHTPVRMPRGAGAPFGIAWDGKRKWLWVAAMCPAEPKIENCGKSGLYALDDRGKVHRALTLERPFNPGDVSVDPASGRVFVSDSLNGAVYGCNDACKVLRPVIRPEGRASAQGTAVTPDGKSLVVADYSRGIILVDLETGKEQMVRTPDGKRLRGIDGLVRWNALYLGIANAANPSTLVTFEIGDGGVLANIREFDTNPLPLIEGTQLAIGDKYLVLVIDSQWRHYAGPDAKGADAQRPTPLLTIPLTTFAP